MITNMDDVLAFFAAPEQADPYMRRNLSKCDPERDALANSPFQDLLPDSYISFVNRYCVDFVRIGDFEPSPTGTLSLLESLEKENGEERLPYIPNGFLNIGSYEGDLILIPQRGASDIREGIYYLEIYPSFSPVPTLLADTLEECVIRMTYFYKLRMDKSNNTDDILNKMFGANKEQVDPKTLELWAFICSISGVAPA